MRRSIGKGIAMRGTNFLIPFGIGLVVLGGCGRSGDTTSQSKYAPATLQVRSERRAFSGAPPVIPHPPMSTSCVSCHTATGLLAPKYGWAPASPHTKTTGMSDASRCQQCHLFQQSTEMFAASDFKGLSAVGLRGERAHFAAPPTIPHATFMREDCAACHSGGAASPEIRCSHIERSRCQQCHVAGDQTADQQPDLAQSGSATGDSFTRRPPPLPAR